MPALERKKKTTIRILTSKLSKKIRYIDGGIERYIKMNKWNKVGTIKC